MGTSVGKSKVDQVAKDCSTLCYGFGQTGNLWEVGSRCAVFWGFHLKMEKYPHTQVNLWEVGSRCVFLGGLHLKMERHPHTQQDPRIDRGKRNVRGRMGVRSVKEVEVLWSLGGQGGLELMWSWRRVCVCVCVCVCLCKQGLVRRTSSPSFLPCCCITLHKA